MPALSERKKEVKRAYYAKNRERIRAYMRDYLKEWELKNRGKVLASKRRYNHKRKAMELSPKCIQCESILKIAEITVCDWCTKTYKK